MTLVAELLLAYRDEEVAGIMRAILNEDVPEEDMALAVQSFNASITSEDLLAAWSLLGSYERSSWKRLMDYDNWLKAEQHKWEQRHAH